MSQQLVSPGHVKLTGLKLGKVDAKQLAESMLKGNESIKELDVSSNQIGDLGAQEMLKVLVGNMTLRALNLSGNKLHTASIAVHDLLVDANALQTLDLSCNQLGDDGAARLAEALAHNDVLLRLNLGFNKIGFKGARKLWTGLAANSRLKSLNLKGNVIGDMGTMALDVCLQTNSTLVSLDLAENHIGESGSRRIAEALKGSKGLMELMLQGNVVGNDAGVSFARALQTNKVVCTLNLNGTKLGGTSAVALGQALESNTTLASLSMLNCDIGTEGANAIEAATKVNRLVVVDATHPKLSSSFEDEMKTRKGTHEADDDGIWRVSMVSGMEPPANRQERDQKTLPQPRPSSQDYQGRSRKEVLAQIAQLSQLAEASKSDGEAGIGVRRDALERILSLAMSISEKDIVLSATAMLKALMDQDSNGILSGSGSATPRKSQTNKLGSPILKSSGLSPMRKMPPRDSPGSQSSITLNTRSGPRPEKKPVAERNNPRLASASRELNNESNLSRSCTLHSLPLHFYDQQCSLTLCQECTATSHKGHAVVSLLGYAAQCRQELAETLAFARKALGASEKPLQEESDSAFP